MNFKNSYIADFQLRIKQLDACYSFRNSRGVDAYDNPYLFKIF